jgi:SAM-dependent methyltransferase
MSREYQNDYSASNPEMHSAQGRQQKAATMRLVLAEVLGAELAQARVLNLGCSTGIIDEYLAPHVGHIVGVDIDEPAVALANSRRRAPNVEFRVEDAMRLSFGDASFDVVVSSQVYEHVPDARQMMREIHRVLRPGGVCYFAATNRWVLLEPHYKLPFLSWLPSALADRYMRLFRKGDAYYERLVGYGALRVLVDNFRLQDFTQNLLAAPDSYGVGYMFGGARLPVARVIFKYARSLFPGYIWLLWKPETAGPDTPR